MTTEELNELAHSLAYADAASTLECMGLQDGLGVVIALDDLKDYEVQAYLDAVTYLEARGLIQRDADKPGWLAVLEESEATAP